MRRALNNALSYRFSNDRAYDGGSTASTASIVGKWRDFLPIFRRGGRDDCPLLRLISFADLPIVNHLWRDY
jgi:hypothetical protein